MKYMTFNSSCSFAGVANMLEAYGVHTEDYQLALGMKIPYIFSLCRETGAYQTGASLQSGQWFNPHLNTLGISLEEERLPASEVLHALKTANKPMMLGINIKEGRKHAVVFTKYANGKYHLLNNRYQHDDAPAEYIFGRDELASRLCSVTTVGRLEACTPAAADFAPVLAQSLNVLERYRRELVGFCRQLHLADALQSAMERLFRPLLLDGLTMMGLTGDADMRELLSMLQAQYLSALRKSCPLILEHELDMAGFSRAFEGYAVLIRRQMQ